MYFLKIRKFGSAVWPAIKSIYFYKSEELYYIDVCISYLELVRGRIARRRRG